MSKKRLWLALAFAGPASVCATSVQAAILGTGSGTASLGQPLEFAVSMRHAAHESVAAECLGAEVQVGERRLIPSQVRVWVETSSDEVARIRVQTTGAIDEPLVSLTVTWTCGSPVSKHYMVLADPPGFESSPAWHRALPAVLAANPPVDGDSLPNRSGAAPGLMPLERVLGGSRSTETVSLPGGTWRAIGLRRPAAAVSGRAARRARAAPRDKAQAMAVAAPKRSSLRGQSVSPVLPRLRLDAVEPLLQSQGAVEQALQAVAQAAAAARQAASAASAAADRIAALERTVNQLRGEARSSRDEAAHLREQVARGESSTSTWVLGAVALGLAVLAGFLAVRLSATRRALALDWESAVPAERSASMTADAAERPPTAAMAFVHSDLDSVPMSAPRTRATPAWPPPAPLDGWVPSQPSGIEESRRSPAPGLNRDVAATSRSAAGHAGLDASGAMAQYAAHAPAATAASSGENAETDPATRDVSIDELLDLEQQAEFFVVLGQDDAAIELLVEHLRHTGGSSPLPYLKLLEIHRRRGSRSDYERMRARFNHHFNAYAPEWEVDLLSGRSLDEYPGVLPRLEQAWPRPADSMAELEAMLFRKSQSELFDLPAYREVLFLYALARDLLDRESVAAGTVDVLLPLPDDNGFSQTSPTPFIGTRHDGRDSEHEWEQRSTGLVDFDLSLDGGRPASIFDPLQETPTHQR